MAGAYHIEGRRKDRVPEGVLTTLATPPKMGLADCLSAGGSGSVSEPGDGGGCGLSWRR